MLLRLEKRNSKRNSKKLSNSPPQKSHNFQVSERRHILLLEVLIAFALVVLCILPLLYPHTYLLREQKEFIHKIELDHAVNLLYATITEKLYKNEIPWGEIATGNVFEIDERLLAEAGYPSTLPYKGSFAFTETIRKPKEESPLTLYLFSLDFAFARPKEPLRYHYDVFITRDLRDSADLPGEVEQTQQEEVPANAPR